MLDFRFAWRWLLPLTEGDTIRLYVFSTAEEHYLAGVLPVRISPHTEQPETLLVNASGCREHGKPAGAAVKAARVVCVVADGGAACYWRNRLSTDFAQVREYGLLPKSHSRVVVPLGSSRHAVTALGLHRPGRLSAQLAVWLARSLARVGNLTLLRSRVVLIAGKDGGAAPNAALKGDWLGENETHHLDYALYLGTPDDNRKTVILPLGSSAPKVILKVAAIPKARTALENEASALMRLGQSPIRGQVPKLVGVATERDSLTLYQEYRPRKRVGKRQMDEAVVAFLTELSRLDAGTQPLADLLSSLPADVGSGHSEAVAGACRALYARLIEMADCGIRLHVHRSHGDFAPWNCAWTAQGLFVFDWEASRPQDIALGDAFYYVIAPALLVRRNAKGQKTLSEVLRLARQVATAGEIDSPEIEVYLALWLLRRLVQDASYGALCMALERSWV